MDKKQNFPESDESSRKSHYAQADEDQGESTERTLNAQMSGKTGKHSTVEKLAASRPEFGEGRGEVPVDGAFGKDPEDNHYEDERRASAGTNQFRCESCGRYFNSETELSRHASECNLAKAAVNR